VTARTMIAGATAGEAIPVGASRGGEQRHSHTGVAPAGAKNLACLPTPPRWSRYRAGHALATGVRTWSFPSISSIAAASMTAVTLTAPFLRDELRYIVEHLRRELEGVPVREIQFLGCALAEQRDTTAKCAGRSASGITSSMQASADAP
jgi:hypothetical protein